MDIFESINSKTVYKYLWTYMGGRMYCKSALDNKYLNIKCIFLLSTYINVELSGYLQRVFRVLQINTLNDENENS